MRRRIAAALDAGERPTLRGNNLRLGSVFLQRADGRDAPALREVELQMTRRALPVAGAFDTFRPGTHRRGAEHRRNGHRGARTYHGTALEW